MKVCHFLRASLATACFFAGDALAQVSAEKATAVTSPRGLYHSDPQHLWNRLHAAFYRRDVEENGAAKRYSLGPDVLDPPLSPHPRFLLDLEPFTYCDAVLEEFLRGGGTELFADPLKRVVLQRDLWAVFDLLQAESDGDRNFGQPPPPLTSAQQENRAILSRKLAQAIAALALSRAQCERLPDTYELAVKSGAFPGNPKNVASQEKADYLPADLLAPGSPWLEATRGTGLFHHTSLVDQRSVFRIFYRPPPDPDGAEKFAAWIVERQRVKASVSSDDLQHREWESVRQGVPGGTQFLLLRELIAIDDQWNLVPTRVVESVQVRVFQPALAEKKLPPAAGVSEHLADFVRLSAQLYEEFELDRASLFRGEKGGLHPTVAGAKRLMGYTGLGRLATDREGRGSSLLPFPFGCAICHTDERAAAEKRYSPMRIMSLEHAAQLLPTPWKNAAATSTVEGKATHHSFRKLRELAATPTKPPGE